MAEANIKKSIFPQKLWQMVNDRRLDSAIRWTDDGRAFFLFEDQLRNLCLGKENKMFFTRQPKSFVRQLHLYGFKKINKNQFSHRHFQRDQPGLLEFIKRSYKPRPVTQAAINTEGANNNNNPWETISVTPFEEIEYNYYDDGSYQNYYNYPYTL